MSFRPPTPPFGAEPYAHSRTDSAPWEPLREHLGRVAIRAGEFAAAFDARDWAAIAGWWHDLGKYAPEFQMYLRASSDGRVARGDGPVHAQAGAIHAIEQLGAAGRALAFVIAGHHTGLADQSGPTDASLERSLRNAQPESRSAIGHAPSDVLMQPPPSVPARFASPGAGPARGSLFIRMLFSCLVDADRLATEHFYEPGRTDDRAGASGPGGATVTMSSLRATLDDSLERMNAARRARYA